MCRIKCVSSVRGISMRTHGSLAVTIVVAGITEVFQFSKVLEAI